MHVQLLNLCGGYEEYHTSHIFELGMFGKRAGWWAAHCITPVDVLAHFLCCTQGYTQKSAFLKLDWYELEEQCVTIA